MGRYCKSYWTIGMTSVGINISTVKNASEREKDGQTDRSTDKAEFGEVADNWSDHGVE